MLKNLIATFVLFIASILYLYASVEVTYTPSSSLQFTAGYTDTATNTTYFSSQYFVAHLGTLVFTSTSGEMFDPTMVSIDTTLQFSFTGPMLNGIETSWFRLAAGYDQNKWERLDHGNFENSLTGSSGKKFTPYTIELFLLGDQAANLYKENKFYEWTSGSFGGFNMTVRKETDTNSYEYIPVNGQTIPSDGSAPTTTQPFLASGATTPNPLPYGEPVSQETYLFTVESVTPFSLIDAYETSVARVATAKLIIGNPIANKEYAVDVMFSNLANSNPFRLHLDGNLQANTLIPYVLTFGGVPINPNENHIWENLATNTPNEREIGVTAIVPSDAENAPQGSYSDTIRVMITPR